MADATGQSSESLTRIKELETHFASFEFFAALRSIECAFPDKPRIGKSARSAEDAARFGQVPALDFAPTMFREAMRREDGRLWLGGAFFGLFGPNGPLPLHLTEYAHDRRHNFRDGSFSGFADIFHHRLLSLFYRGWADAQPTVQQDRASTDRFRTYVGALLGIGQPSLQDRDAMPDPTRLFHAGRMASQVRNSEGLKVILEDFFGETVRILEFQCEWLPIAAGDRLYLGQSPSTGTLGVSSILGSQVWGAQSRFRIAVGSLSLEAFEHFLPGSLALRQLHAIVRNYVGYEYDWDVQLIVDRGQVPGMRLGDGARLGWSSWLMSAPPEGDAADVVLRSNH